MTADRMTAVVRLYLANGIIIVGLALFTHTWVAPPVVMVLTAGYYACIVQGRRSTCGFYVAAVLVERGVLPVPAGHR